MVLSAYAFAVQCPVLIWCMVLSVYAFAVRCPVLPGTDLVYVAICPRCSYVMCGLGVVLSAYACAIRCLRFCCALCSTDLVYGTALLGR
eukprot:2466888-Rhodomonas_salina.2